MRLTNTLLRLVFDLLTSLKFLDLTACVTDVRKKAHAR